MLDVEKNDDELSFEDELKRLAKADPFEPFQIKLTSGDAILVRTDDYIEIGANVISVIGQGAGQWVVRKNQVVATYVPPLNSEI